MKNPLQSILLGAVIAATACLASPASAQTLLSVDFNGYWYQVTEPTYTGINPGAEQGAPRLFLTRLVPTQLTSPVSGSPNGRVMKVLI